VKRILVVAVAGKVEPWLVAPVAQLAKETKAEVTVLGVDDVESQRFEPLPRDVRVSEAEETARRLAGLLAEEGVGATAMARGGPAAPTAIEFANEVDADLVVVGSSRRHGIAERLLGSLPFELVRSSGRQVLVVTGPD
jgi:nucleotide-binding universal stress UspA family protein